jgi:hypothetical protein
LTSTSGDAPSATRKAPGGQHAARRLIRAQPSCLDPLEARRQTPLYFQRVPEPKTVKNRLHLDLDVAARGDSIAARTADVEAEVVRLVAVGAAVIKRVSDHDHFHVTMGDPEGNEFDLR